MDEIDIATEQQMRDLELLIQAARGQEPVPRRVRCPDCGERLAPHRVPYGYCVECAGDREAKQRWR